MAYAVSYPDLYRRAPDLGRLQIPHRSEPLT
jgi:hypothetical protein